MFVLRFFIQPLFNLSNSIRLLFLNGSFPPCSSCVYFSFIVRSFFVHNSLNVSLQFIYILDIFFIVYILSKNRSYIDHEKFMNRLCIIYALFIHRLCIVYASFMYHLKIVNTSFMLRFHRLCIVYTSFMHHLHNVNVSLMYRLRIFHNVNAFEEEKKQYIFTKAPSCKTPHTLSILNIYNMYAHSGNILHSVFNNTSALWIINSELLITLPKYNCKCMYSLFFLLVKKMSPRTLKFATDATDF